MNNETRAKYNSICSEMSAYQVVILLIALICRIKKFNRQSGYNAVLWESIIQATQEKSNAEIYPHELITLNDIIHTFTNEPKIEPITVEEFNRVETVLIAAYKISTKQNSDTGTAHVYHQANFVINAVQETRRKK